MRLCEILWVPDIFWDRREAVCLVLIKHSFFLTCKTIFFCGIFCIDLEIMSLKSYPNCFCYKHCSLKFYVSIQHVLFYLAFMFIFVFSKLRTAPSFCFWHPVYFSSPFPYLLFCFPAPLLSLNKSMWLEQPSTACHINFILLQIPLKKSPFLFSSHLPSGPLSFWSRMFWY